MGIHPTGAGHGFSPDELYPPSAEADLFRPGHGADDEYRAWVGRADFEAPSMDPDERIGVLAGCVALLVRAMQGVEALDRLPFEEAVTALCNRITWLAGGKHTG